MTQTTANSQTEQNKTTFTKKIKSTDYEVSVYFSDKSKETINDKIARLIRNEVFK
jgi:hypothetical protein